MTKLVMTHNNLLRTAIAIVALFAAMTLATGCASLGKKLKSFLGGKDSTETTPQKKTVGTKFSEQENLRYGSQRQYRRMNRQKFEEEAEVAPTAGSLWVAEGQNAYLFSQNTTRMVGDPLNVTIEGGPKSQLQSKVKVISKLLERLDNPPSRGLASAQAQGQAAAQAAQTAQGQAGATGQPPGAAAQAAGAAPAPVAEAAKPEIPFSVERVPTRIVEVLKDGSYRVRGMQPFMIGKREYKVIVTGVVRPEDFDDGGTNASKLLDAQFDVVSTKRGVSL